MVAAFVHALPYILCWAFVLFMFYGFWQGLSLRPHGDRPPNRVFWWMGPNN